MSTSAESKPHPEAGAQLRRHWSDEPPRVPDHELHRIIGRGSYGEVWLARNAVGTWRAVKVVYRDRFEEYQPYEREFVGIQKYEPVSRTNEGLVDVLQIGRNEAEGYFYYVMELADDAGEAGREAEAVNDANPATVGCLTPSPSRQATLSPRTYIPRTLALNLLRRGRLTFEECVTLGLKLNLALGHLHRHGLIHRDVKPPNIIFVDGVPKLADIGLVANVTGADSYVGTEGYVAPEGPNSSQADLYALGKVLYEICTGHDRLHFPKPFDGLDQDPEAEGLRELITVTERACAENRLQRYRSAEEMNADLALLHSGRSVRQKHAVERRLKFTTRLAAAAVALLGLGVFPYYLAIREGIAARMAARQEAEQRQRAQASERETIQAQEGEARARAIAEQRLYDSLVREANATRLARRVGYRDKVFDLLKQANALKVPQKDVAELRHEATACLGDFVGFAPKTFSDFPVTTTIRSTVIDPTGQVVAFLLSDRIVLLRQLPSGKEVARFELSGDSPTRHFCFNGAGNQLLFVRVADGILLEDRIRDSRLQVWTRGMDRRWRETENVALPGAVECVNTSRGWFVMAYAENPRVGQLIDATTLGVVWRFECPPGWIPEVALSPDGELLATETTDPANPTQPELDIWHLDSGERLARLSPQLGVLKGLVFSPHGDYLMCSGESSGAIYEVKRFTHVASFSVGARVPLVFAPDSELVAVPVSKEHKIRLWDWARNDELAKLDEPQQATRVLFAPDGSYLLTVSSQSARLYHLDQTPERMSLLRHLGNRTGVAFCPDGLRVATAGLNPAVRVSEAATGREIWRSEKLPTIGHAPVFSPDGRWLAVGDFAAKRVFIFDSQTGEKLLEQPTAAGGRFWSVQFSPDGRHLATASLISRADAQGVELWEIGHQASGGPVSGLRMLPLRQAGASAWNLAFSPDGRWLAYVDRVLRGVYLWEFGTQTPPRCLGTNLIGGIGNDQSVSFTPDGRHLRLIDATRSVITVDVETGEQVASFSTVNPKRTPFWTDASGICLSPDGGKLAMISASGCGVDIWEPRTGRLLYVLPESDDTVHWLAWHPDSLRLAITRSNGDIEIWNCAAIEKALSQLALGR